MKLFIEQKDPIDNKTAQQLMGICHVIAVIHFAMGFIEVGSVPKFFLLYFGVVVAVVLFIGIVVFAEGGGSQ